MCLTLPRVLITVMGIEKVLPEWRDLEVFVQLLPRSATGERMNPYTSLWTGVHAGDGPQEFHLVLLDNGRTDVLADEVGRQALHCIRCSACLNSCPVYSRVGGHAYESVYPGPIGAILTPQLRGLENAPTLPWASSLCGACYEVCPVKIDIPSVLLHLRARVVREYKSRRSPEALGMEAVGRVFGSQRAYERAQKLARLGRGPIVTAALPGWSAMRGLPEVPEQTFREWWRARRPGPRRRRASAVSGGREAVLARVRAALGPAVEIPEVPRAYRQAGALGAGGDGVTVDLFCARVADYRATVRRVRGDELPGALMAACEQREARRIAVPAQAPPWTVEGVELVRDDPPLSPRQLDELDGVLSGCALAIAETGTIVLDGVGASGRRALTLVPDYHLCVVRSADIVPSVPDAWPRWPESPRRAGRSPLSRARRPPSTSSSSASRAFTAPARSTCSSSTPPCE